MVLTGKQKIVLGFSTLGIGILAYWYYITSIKKPPKVSEKPPKVSEKPPVPPVKEYGEVRDIPEEECQKRNAIWEDGKCKCPPMFVWNVKQQKCTDKWDDISEVSKNECSAHGGYWDVIENTCKCPDGEKWDKQKQMCEIPPEEVPTPVPAEFTIAGVVEDRITFQPITNATVEILKDTRVAYSVKTDTNGEYMFLVKQDTYSVRGYAKGYITATGDVVKIDKDYTADIKLFPERVTATISGTVKDVDTEMAVAGATVEFQKTKVTIYTVKSDAKGAFRFNVVLIYNVPYSVKVSAPNYKTFKGGITVYITDISIGIGLKSNYINVEDIPTKTICEAKGGTWYPELAPDECICVGRYVDDTEHVIEWDKDKQQCVETGEIRKPPD